jgi:hypothetical protein
LKYYLIMSGSLSEAPASTTNKDELATIFVDFRPRPLALVGHGAHRSPVFREALAPRFLFSTKATEARCGASTRAGTTCTSMRCRASAFE